MGYICPSCGYPGLDVPPYKNATSWPLPRDIHPPYSAFLGEASYDVCACCGFEFGNDDEPGLGSAGDSFEEYLAEWICQGNEWLDPSRRPTGWSLKRQLAAAGLVAYWLPPEVDRLLPIK